MVGKLKKNRQVTGGNRCRQMFKGGSIVQTVGTMNLKRTSVWVHAKNKKGTETSDFEKKSWPRKMGERRLRGLHTAKKKRGNQTRRHLLSAKYKMEQIMGGGVRGTGVNKRGKKNKKKTKKHLLKKVRGQGTAGMRWT